MPDIGILQWKNGSGSKSRDRNREIEIDFRAICGHEAFTAPARRAMLSASHRRRF